MKFTILTENRNCDNNCINEDGLSILIEMDSYKVLLDTGITDAFLKNAETLGINCFKSWALGSWKWTKICKFKENFDITS